MIIVSSRGQCPRLPTMRQMSNKHTHLPKYNTGAHFLTAKTFNNIPYLGNPACARIFCEELESARVRYGFDVIAFVVMPDHIHLLLWWDRESIPELTISKIAWAVKGKSARRIVEHLKRVREGNAKEVGVGEGIALAHPMLQPVREPEDRPHHRKWRYRVWQPGAGYDFNIYTPHKLWQKLNYIHANPVRAGLVMDPIDYPWSSASAYTGLQAVHPVEITFHMEVF